MWIPMQFGNTPDIIVKLVLIFLRELNFCASSNVGEVTVT